MNAHTIWFLMFVLHTNLLIKKNEERKIKRKKEGSMRVRERGRE